MHRSIDRPHSNWTLRSPARVALLLAPILFASLTTGVVASDAHAAEAEPTTVIAAEYAFAQSSKPLGVRGAFLKWLAPDSIVCDPAPVNGIVSTAAGAANADTLDWYPTHSQTAPSDDLGYTTGPWTYRTADGKTEVNGTFLSVWRKQPDNTWRVVLDCGISHAKPEVAPPALKAPTANTTSETSTQSSNWRDPVAAADTRFTAAAAHGAAAALKSFGAADVRVMTRGVLVAVGIEAGQALLNAQKIGSTWQHVYSSQSNDGTLGYTWGYVGDAQAETPAAAYVNIWRRASAAAPWKIVAQSLQVLPRKKS